MKHFSFLLFITLLVTPMVATAQTNGAKEKEILALVLKTLKEKHVSPKKIDDDFSRKMFKTYIDSLDTNRLFFLQSDIDEFKKYETKLDDQINANDLTFYDLTRKRYFQRMTEAKEIYTNLFKNKFDFEIKENHNPLIISFSKNKYELYKNWSRFIKSEILYNLRDVNISDLSQGKFNEIIQDFAINKIAAINHQSWYNVDNMTNDLVLEFFLNSMVIQYENNSAYLLPFNVIEYFTKKNDKQKGLGFTFNLKENFIAVADIIIGGPAWKTKKIDIGDIILKIAFDEENPVNISGFSIFDVVKLTKSKKANVVTITIKKPNGSIEVVPIKRGVVSTNDSYIKSSIVEKNKAKYAVISFSRFYNELDEDEMRNSQDDFLKTLLALNKAKVQGLVLDMRGNMGGSLESATKILGNFISKNIVVQYKNNDNILNVLKTETETKTWNKSIVLLVDTQSKSSTEMIANAFKEYNVGVVVGENTYGNGTIQEFLDLNKLQLNKDIDFGALIVTTHKFYGLTGKSIQKTGVIPDINFTSKNNIIKENFYATALLPDFVKPLELNRMNSSDYFTKVIEKSKSRLSKNKIYNLIINNKLETDIEKITTLNAGEFKKQYDELIKKIGVSPLDEYSNSLTFLPTSNDEKTFKNKEYLLPKRKQWYKSLSQDFMIEESLNILEDMNKLK